MNIITFGEIMLRLKSPGYERLFQSPQLEVTFGGGEANVAVGLAKLGMDTQFVSCIPSSVIGDACICELKAKGVGTEFIYRSDGRLGIYFLESGANQRPSKVVYDRVGSLMSLVGSGSIDWGAIFEDACWFHISGITPALSSAAAEQSLLAVRTARQKGVKVSCDLNYRNKLWNYGKRAVDVMPEIASYADVLIGNEEDFQMSLGYSNSSDVTKGSLDLESYRQMCSQVLAASPRASFVGVTLRKSISASHNVWRALLASREGAFLSKEYQITNIVDRVGAGDSFSAGLIYALCNGYEPEEALEIAVALSCLKHSIPGDFSLTSESEVMALAKGDGSGRVQR